MARLVFLLVCGVALVAGQARVQTVDDLPKQLRQLNARLASIASKGQNSKASVASLMAEVENYDNGYAKKAYKPKYAPKYEKEYEPKDEKEYEPKYEDKYAPKYEDKYEKEDKYAPKYEEPKYEKEDSYEAYPSKFTTKVYEKFRSEPRYQTLVKDPKDPVADPNLVPLNLMTYSFTSELTCQNPKGEMGPDHKDGIMDFPIVADHMKLVTVGVCEWSVTEVAPQVISEHATLKGSTNVVCTFNDEAERYCKNGDILQKGLTISGQGLIYNFVQEPAAYYPAAPYKAEVQYAVAPVPPVKPEGIDVFLTLINGVVCAGKHLKYDNGALQFFYGAPLNEIAEVEPVEPGKKAAKKVGVRDVTKYAPAKGDPTGDITLVFKS